MKSREKFSENSILDHFLQQHLLFDHSSNYDKLITIHISVGRMSYLSESISRYHILLDILCKKTIPQQKNKKIFLKNNILRTMYVLRRITKMRIRISNSLLASTSPWDTWSCCLTRASPPLCNDSLYAKQCTDWGLRYSSQLHRYTVKLKKTFDM